MLQREKISTCAKTGCFQIASKQTKHPECLVGNINSRELGLSDLILRMSSVTFVWVTE